jgi:predicted membrane-bound mannosyltransferase
MNVTQVIEQQPEVGVTSRSLVIRREALAYLALALLALVLRLAQLDVVPLSSGEARQALAAWRTVFSEAAGSPIVPESPLLYMLHGLSFSVLGPSEFSARALTVLAGIALMFSPLLFRAMFGQTRTFVFCLLLFFSPAMLATSRMDSPVVWTLLAAVLSLWGWWRYSQQRQTYHALLATVCLTAMIFLTEPAGVYFSLALGLAGLFAIRFRPDGSKQNGASEASDAASSAAFPWRNAFLMALLAVFLVSTWFMFNPAGLSAVGELLAAGLRGLTTPRPFVPTFFPLLTVLFYEPLIFIVGVVAALRLFRSDEAVSVVDRFLLGWLIFGLVLALVYAAAGPEHALWIILPLIGLASRSVTGLITAESRRYAPDWVRWAVALVTAGLMAILAVHGQSLARSMMGSPDSLFQLVSVNAYNVVWLIIVVLFALIGYFYVSSEWDEGTALRGGVLGLLAFMLVTGLGSGWHIAVANADDPVEFWNRNPTGSATLELRHTLMELADRQTGGFPEMAVTVLASDDSVLAWLLRDFPNTTFITDVAAARGQEIVLLPTALDKPDLGGGYVGQKFVISRNWNLSGVGLPNFPAWWLQRRTLTGALPTEEMTLWLRQDVYNGTQADGLQ